jgi:hypothetical protein
MKSPTNQPRKDPFHLYSLSPRPPQFQESAGATPIFSLWFLSKNSKFYQLAQVSFFLVILRLVLRSKKKLKKKKIYVHLVCKFNSFNWLSLAFFNCFLIKYLLTRLRWSLPLFISPLFCRTLNHTPLKDLGCFPQEDGMVTIEHRPMRDLSGGCCFSTSTIQYQQLELKAARS